MKTKTIKAMLENAGLYLPSNMLSVSNDSKTVKGEKLGYLTGILYLIPDNELCPASKLAGCQNPCLVSAGRGRFNSVINGRANKTAIYKQFPEIFYYLIEQDIEKLQRKAEKQGLDFCVRLNGTSDIDHSAFIASIPDVQFYDYTKRLHNVMKANGLHNYHITFSYSGANPRYIEHVRKAIAAGANVATVFNGALPEKFMGLPVINGDDSDLRFLDHMVSNGQCIVGLTAKGNAKKDNSGFVVNSNIIAMG
jgi:hypothetical protein